jgi:hypothetical protein
MSHIKRALAAAAVMLALTSPAPAPNPACLVPFPWHCDPPPKA